MKRMREDVQKFYGVRVILTPETGEQIEHLYGPLTTLAKAREIETRLARVWNSLLTSTGPRKFVSIRYVIEQSPVLGWHVASSNEYTRP